MKFSLLFRISVVSKKFENLDEVEPWYGTKYTKTEIPENTIKVSTTVL